MPGQNGQINHAPIVGGKCHQGGMGGASIAPMPVNKPAIGKSGERRLVTPANGKRNTGGYDGQCAHCGQPFIAKRRTKRYCSSTCRIYAHYARTGGRPCRVCGESTGTANGSICSPACRVELDRQIAARRAGVQNG